MGCRVIFISGSHRLPPECTFRKLLGGRVGCLQLAVHWAEGGRVSSNDAKICGAPPWIPFSHPLNTHFYHLISQLPFLINQTCWNWKLVPKHCRVLVYNCLGWCIKHCQSRVDIMAFYTLNNWERDLLHLDRDSRCRIERDIYSCETDWEWQWRLPSLIFYWYLLQMPCHALSFLISHFLPPFSGGESCRRIGIYIYLQTLSVLGERGGSTTNP